MDILEEEFDSFDLVLMDLLMPVSEVNEKGQDTYQCANSDATHQIMGGLEATVEIRKLEERLPPRKGEAPRSVSLNGRIPVIAVTASLPERERHTIVDAGLGALGLLTWLTVATELTLFGLNRWLAVETTERRATEGSVERDCRSTYSHGQYLPSGHLGTWWVPGRTAERVRGRYR